jgi:hypothetical protein
MPPQDKWDQYAEPAAASDKWAQYAEPAAAPAENPITAPLSKATGIGPAPSVMDRLRAGHVPGLDDAVNEFHKVGNQPKGNAAFPPPPTMAGKVGQTAGMLVKNPAMGALTSTIAPEVESPLPSTARAGRNFEEVLKAAKGTPVDVEKAGAAGLRAKELVERGSSPVQVINKFMNRVTDPEKGPLTYEEARDFYVNARMNMMEKWKNVGGPMWRQVTLFKEALGQAIEDAATEAGKGGEYQDAMKEYKMAARLKKFGMATGAAAAGKALTEVPLVGPMIKGAVRGSLGK